ncbi:MAG: lytic transglycosylase domain-containing protein, partial [Bacteroidales bacterium]|nr:lytic transglycosylase domain-containing protein [Bacteroidales bacterium]
YYPVRNPARYETVSGPILSLVDFAKLNGVTYRELKLANPWLTGTSLENKNGKTYKIAIPDRSGRR